MNEIHINSKMHGSKLESSAIVPDELRKYFTSSSLCLDYNDQLDANESILNIPLMSTILPLAWLTGTDIHVEKLDSTYFEAIQAIKPEFKQMYPKGKFTTEILVDDLVENNTNSKGTALLFSGGVDSTYSLLRNISEKPRLVMLWGVQQYQLYPSFAKYTKLVRDTYSDFAKLKSLEFNFVETNIYDILNYHRVDHDFFRVVRGSSVFSSLQLPLFLLGLLAPLSIGRFNHALIAATFDSTHDYMKYPYASKPGIDEKFAWADSRVTHDGYVQRFEKIPAIAEFLQTNTLPIKVCNHPPHDKLNCDKCEKCYGVISSLLLFGINPNLCGFEVDNLTLKSLREMFENNKIEGLDLAGDIKYWKVLQSMIPNMKQDLYGSKEFFEWFKTFDLDQLKKKKDWYRSVFNRLPYSLALVYEALYYSARRRFSVKN